jgi:PAS domain S-box-containing protein
MYKKEKADESAIDKFKQTILTVALNTADDEKKKLVDELIIAKEEKAELADELIIVNVEKAKRAAELVIANEEKEKRAEELVIAKADKAKRAAELVIANTEKVKCALELVMANAGREKRADKLIIADKELVYQNEEKAKRAAELVIANIEKSKRSAEIVFMHKELVLAIEKEKLVVELTIVNKELTNQVEKRKQTELALKESNEKYSKAFQSSPYSITISRLEDGGYIEVNDTFVSISGFTRKEALSNSVIGTNIWVDKEERNSVISALLSGKNVEGKEFQFRKKNGEIMTGLFCAKIIYINKEPYMISSVDDITERKIAENLLKESEQKSMSIMENSADAIFITNQQGKYVYTNKAVSVMLGYTSEEMKSKTISDISPPNKIKEYFKFFEQILNEGKGFTEIELLKKDGNYISTDLNAVILPDGTIYESCRDITERKQAESELIKAKEKAEESDRLRSAFLTNMSHEIRTPMNGILGFAELLKEPNLSSDDQQDFIQTIQISGARMLNTINSIVDMSKIESGLTKVNIQETILNEKIEFTYKFFKPEVEIKGLKFLFKNGLPLNESIIKTDNEKVYGILTNLVRNAIKFTYEGSIEFGYKKKGEYLEFFVKDTGIGVPKRQHQIIFERFRQGSESHNRGYEGSGLGLSIAKSYVEMLGGEIWVESEEGKGSIFYFTIPYNPALGEKVTIENVVSAEHKEVEIKNLKILIVEDDEISYSLLTRTLQKISYEVLHAITGVQAIEACRNNPDLDLVLMDIRMPNMDGNEATRQIRQFNKDVIIIAQTAYAFTGDKEKSIEAGCNDYISKPINKTLLYELIRKYINK